MGRSVPNPEARIPRSPCRLGPEPLAVVCGLRVRAPCGAPSPQLLLNDLLEVAPGFGVMKKSLFEFVVLLRSRLWFGVSPKRASAFRFPLADIWPDLRSSLRRLRIGPKS